MFIFLNFHLNSLIRVFYWFKIGLFSRSLACGVFDFLSWFCVTDFDFCFCFSRSEIVAYFNFNFTFVDYIKIFFLILLISVFIG